MAQGKLKEIQRIIQRALNGGDPEHDRTKQAKLNEELPPQLQPPKPHTKYNYLGQLVDDRPD